MKCEFCGTNLGIEDEVCPYCGKPNSFATKHNKDMKQFKRRYASTREEVLENSRKFNKMTVRISIVSVLIALVAISIVVATKHYSIERYREERQILKHIDEHKSKLDKMIEERDYLGISFYDRCYKISRVECMAQYREICRISSDYWSYITYYNYLLEDSEYWQDDEIIDRLADIACSMHDFLNPNDYLLENYYNDTTFAYVKDLNDHIDVLIQGHFNISDEDMEGFWELSDAERIVMMERNYKNGREE